MTTSASSKSDNRQPVPALMIQGTGSDVGKSLLVAGLARAFTRRGLTVRPFKPQNMSNNAAVTQDGGEIGRAQALQARACGVNPSVHMNPVLLKPQSDQGAQIIVQGHVYGTANAQDYHRFKPDLLPRVLESFGEISKAADLVLIEGAGSPAEVNLRESDIANMGFAEAADVPVVLVGDIERGGVIAALVGTHALLPESERARIKGYIINKFRGDPSLFDPALDIIKDKTGLCCFGVVPWLKSVHLLPAEDSVALDHRSKKAQGSKDAIRIAVPRLPHIANFDDFDPLKAEANVDLQFVPPGQPLPIDADLIILPGSKTTIADLAALRAEGWDIDLYAHHRRGGRVLGICAGYQMLGRRIADPLGVEGEAEDGIAALGLLDVETLFGRDKTLTKATGTDDGNSATLKGYEMHMGETFGPDCARPFLDLNRTASNGAGGAGSADGRVQGCYVHGLFADDGFRRNFLSNLCDRGGQNNQAGNFRESGPSFEARIEAVLDELADLLEAELDLTRLLEIARDR
jgi:adenosylcobyric acid synthase